MYNELKTFMKLVESKAWSLVAHVGD